MEKSKCDETSKNWVSKVRGPLVEPGNPKGTSKSAMISTTNNVYQVQNNNNLNTKYNKYMYTPDTNISPKKKVTSEASWEKRRRLN